MTQLKKEAKPMKKQDTLRKIKAAVGTSGTSPLHISGIGHVTGRSQFVDDMPKPRGILSVSMLTSPLASGKILELDVSAARAMKGVLAVITAKEIPGVNQIGAIVPDETCLAEGHVAYVGEPVAIVAAETKAIADAAVKKIVLKIEEQTPVLTVEDALAKNMFVGPIRKIEHGKVDAALASAPHVLEGVVKNEGQEHFYLETQRAICIPEEGGALTLYSSSQNPNEIHRMTSGVLGIPQNQLTVDVKRLGGAFGGKESQATQWATLAALATYHTGRPAEVILDREEDMQSTGKRHAFESKYRVGFDDEGHILAYHVELQSNCGAFADASTSILERAMMHAENAYNIPNIRVIGKPCRTNIQPATAFRGFGAPQGIFAIESVIERVAYTLKLDPYEVRQRNIYRKGDFAPYGEPVGHAEHMGVILEKLKKDSSWCARRARVDEYNSTHRYCKKGLAMVPVKFGISFTAAHLNQGQALMHVYLDGSISVTHGAIEMGQEVNTKIAQIAATTLGVPFSYIRVETTNTKRVANTSPTAASSGCDLNGHAVENAALEISARLRKFSEETFNSRNIRFENGQVYALDAADPSKPVCTFRELIKKAYFGRVDLSAHGFYASPGISFDREAGTGNPFLYFVFGAAVTEVSVDLLNGRVQVDSVDVLHDSGRSLNPIVDIGQIHGAFVQGMGWVTMEELVYNAKGRLLSDSPATYKIPTIGDSPTRFNVELLEDSDNELGVHRSKANGEPPFIYGEAVFFAVVNALASKGKYPLGLTIPATPEKILGQLE